MFDTKRYVFVQSILVIFCMIYTVPVVFGRTDDPPNIIVIMFDDFGVDALNAGPWVNDPLGSYRPETPTLSRLSDIGVSFTHCRVNPNCSPTRASLFTGRLGIHTGVTGVVGRYADIDNNPCPTRELMSTEKAIITDLTSLPNYERTIAEVLQDEGYYTILVDKWHIGHDLTMEVSGNISDDRGLQPTKQGFDIFIDWMTDICDDKPDVLGDEHMVTVADQTVDVIEDLGDQPYALFYHTITPHALWRGEYPDGVYRKWWEVDPVLIPSTMNYGDTEVERFLQNVEAIDTVIRDNLLEKLEVITESLPPYNFTYIEDSNTVVIFLGDNGTDDSLPGFGGKNTPYEGGSNVPMIVFGENISGTPLGGTHDTSTQITHVDFFDTIADIAGIDAADRDNNVGMPREGISFAHKLSWAETGDEREYTLTSYIGTRDGHDVYLASFVRDDQYKIITRGGGAGMEPMIYYDNGELLGDEFYDLYLDPAEEDNLIQIGMTEAELDIYYDMRDLIVDHWPISVSESYAPATIPSYRHSHYHASEPYVLEVWIVFSEGSFHLRSISYDGFYQYVIDPDRENNLLDNALSADEQIIYDAMRAEVEASWNSGNRFTPDPNVRVIDLPLSDSKFAGNTQVYPVDKFPIGHANVGDTYQTEYRIFLTFDESAFNDLVPDGYSITDIERAQLIIDFDHDSTEFKVETAHTFWEDDAPTGLIRIYRVPDPWDIEMFSNVDMTTEYGFLDLPPHIIASETGQLFPEDDPEAIPIHLTPMASGTPVSFGHDTDDDDDLLKLFLDWSDGTLENYGIALVADLIDPAELYSADGNPTTQNDQQVNFLRNAVLRVTLKRDY